MDLKKERNLRMKIYRVGIIGAGQIAGGYDDLNSEDVLTHAHAFNDNPQIDFIGFYDINSNKAKEMAKKWETKFFDKLDLFAIRQDFATELTRNGINRGAVLKKDQPILLSKIIRHC